MTIILSFENFLNVKIYYNFMYLAKGLFPGKYIF